MNVSFYFLFSFFFSLSFSPSLPLLCYLPSLYLHDNFLSASARYRLAISKHPQTNKYIYLFIYLGSTHCNPFHRHREGLLFFLFFSLSLFIYFPFCVSILFPQFIFFVSSDVSFCHFPCWLRLLSFSSFFFSSFSIILLLLRLLGWSMTSAFRV